MSDEAAGEGRMPAPAEGPDAVVEYYKQFLDESLLRESGKLTPEQRLEKFFSFMKLVGEVQRAGAAARAEAAEAAAAAEAGVPTGSEAPPPDPPAASAVAPQGDLT